MQTRLRPPGYLFFPDSVKLPLPRYRNIQTSPDSCFCLQLAENVLWIHAVKSLCQPPWKHDINHEYPIVLYEQLKTSKSKVHLWSLAYKGAEIFKVGAIEKQNFFQGIWAYENPADGSWLRMKTCSVKKLTSKSGPAVCTCVPPGQS